MPAGAQHEPQPRTTPSVRIVTLGGFRVVLHGRELDERAWRRKTGRQLLKILLSRPNRRISRDEVVEILWPDSDPEAASINLRSAIHALRRTLSAAELVVREDEHVVLRQSPELWIDADEFEQTLESAHGAQQPLALLERASALYSGDYLPDDVYEDWSTPKRDLLKRAWIDLQMRLAEELENQSDIDGAVRALQRVLELERTDERVARELMRVLTAAGRASEAARVHQEVGRALREELGVEPSQLSVELQKASAERERRLVLARTTGFRCAYPFPSPRVLVGRAAELTRLQRIAERARTGGQTVLVSGPAGAGKSSFVGRVIRSAQEDGVLCLAGGSHDSPTPLPLEPFQEALTDYVLNVPLDSEAADANLSVGTSQLAEVVRELRQHLGVSSAQPIDPATARMRLFGAILTFLRRASERMPVLLCVEDLHAADAATLQLVHYLARQTRSARVALLGTFRAEEISAGSPLAQLLSALGRERLLERIELPPLDEADTGRMIADLLDGPVAGELTSSVYSVTEGNALFVEQLVLSLREKGQLDRLQGAWSPGSLDGSQLPTVIRDVIEQRVQHLGREGRAMLQIAAVLGPSFEYQSLMDVSLAAGEPVDEGSLSKQLDEAIRAQVVRETATGYAFAHALVHQGLYLSISRTRRMLLHMRAGENIEQTNDRDVPERVGRLAEHFRLATPSPNNQSKAFRYSLQAGRTAAALGSHREAMTHFTAACELADSAAADATPAERIEALEGRGRAERELARWQHSIATYEQVLRLADSPLRRARARSVIAYALQHTGNTPRALAELETGLRELAGLPTSVDTTQDRLYLSQLVAWCWYLQGRYRDMLRLGRELLEEARAMDEPRSLMLALGVIATGHMGLGEVRAGLDEQHRRLTAAEQTGDKIFLAVALENLGFQLYLGGFFSEASHELDHALSIYRDAASDLRAVNARQHLCRVMVGEGQLASALEDTSLALSLELAGQERWAADGHQILGSIHLLQSNWREARSNLEAGLNIRQRVGDLPGMVESAVSLGRVDEFVGNWSEANRRYSQALEWARRMDAGPGLLQALRHLAYLRMLQGDELCAQELLDQASAISNSIPDTLEYGPTLRVSAEWHLRHGDFEAALSLARHALAAPAQLEDTLAASLLLAHLEAAVARPEPATAYAREALRIAEQLESPHWRSWAHLAVAVAAASSGSSAQDVQTEFEAALACATEAETPLAQLTALRAYADYLEKSQETGRPAQLQAEADRIQHVLVRGRGGDPAST
jgi:DNA-binding SARP family transcriptional activator